MPRTLHADMKTAAAAETGEIFHLFDLGFSGGTLYLTDASNDVTWNGNAYTAIGGLSYDAVQETTVLGAQTVRLTLDGVDTSIITRILQQNYIGQTAIIRFAHMATDGTITSNPVIVFQGLMNAAFEVKESFGDRGGGSASVTTRLVSPFAIINKLNGIRATVASHSAVFSGDTFFRHMPDSGVAIEWGNPTPVHIGGGGSGPGTSGREGDIAF